MNRKRKRAKSVQYSQELADKICDRLAAGESLNAICSDAGMPDERAVRKWALDPEHEFSPKYARAREVGYHKMADDILEIADDAAADDVQCARLRVETRKWLLSKVLPKIYGDRLDLKTTITQTHEQAIEELSLFERVAAARLGPANGPANNGSAAGISPPIKTPTKNS